MALTTCNLCGNHISSTAKKDCPVCAEMSAVVKGEIVVLMLFFVVLMVVVKHIPQNPKQGS